MIILCDDDETHLKDIHMQMKHYIPEAEVVSFSNCCDVMKYLEEIEGKGIYPCLLLIDLLMPKVNGIDCIKKIRGKFPPFPIIAMSGAITSEQVTQLYRYNVHSVITKPQNWENTIKSIKTMWVDQVRPSWVFRSKTTRRKYGSHRVLDEDRRKR